MKTKKQNLLLISHEKQLSNKLYTVLRQIFLIEQLTYDQDCVAYMNTNEVALILLIGCQSPQDTHVKLKALRSISGISPIILISDISNPKFIIQSFRLGIVDFIQVPVDMSELISVIHRELKPTVILQSPQKAAGLWTKYIPNFTKELLPEELSVIPRTPLFGIDVAPDSVAFLEVQFFGKFSIHFENQNIENLFSKRTKSLLAFLLYNYKKPISRDKLAELFWPYHATAKNNLNVAIHGIRKIFNNLLPDIPIINLENDCYVFTPNLIIQTDAERVEQLYRSAKAIANNVNTTQAAGDFQTVVSHYKGDFLEGIYEPWTERKRDHYREIYLYSLNQLSNIYFQVEQFFEAIKYNEMMLEKDACMEEVHRKLMICYHRLNRNIKVIRQYQKCEKALASEMGIVPSKKTVELLEELRRA